MGGTYDKLYKEVPTYKLITPSIVSERLKVRGSLARRALLELESKNLIKLVVAHSSQMIYTRMIGDAPEDEGERGRCCGGEERKREEGQGRGESIGEGREG